LLASPSGAQVAPLIPWIDQVISWRPTWQELHGKIGLEPERELLLIRKFREEAFEYAFIFTSFTQSPYPPAYACYLAGIPFRIGLSVEFGGVILSHWGKPPEISSHQVDRNLRVIRLAGINDAGSDIRLSIPEKIKESARDLLSFQGVEEGQPYIVVAPGASCQSRRYPAENFALVAQRLAAETGLKILVLGSRKEVNEIQPVMDIADGKKIINLVGTTNITQYAAIVSNAALLVSNNSASMHIGDAFQRPMIILYSGTEYKSQWAPRHSPAVLLNRDTWCSPCFKFDCPYNLECLDIPVSEIIHLSVDLLSKSRNNLMLKNSLMVEESFTNAINGNG
jgi:ADP-heptose:LPS heptosyltransferase